MPPAVMTSAPQASAADSGADTELWKKKSFWQLLNLSIGFLGIQFAWAIQMGQMSPILEKLGSNPQLLGLISCAGPVTGVLVQPIIGALSDKCGLSMGRRRPFLLLGAILTAVALFLMPSSSSLLMAAVLLWLLDASINTTQGPYRALVPDVVHKSQQATAYALMSLTIGLGSVAAFLIAFKIADIHQLFYLGASVMLVAMIWTSFTTPEPKPQTVIVDEGPQENFVVSTMKSIASMPKEGLKLCIAHTFTWFGLMCLFTFFSVFVPHHIFGAMDPKAPMYNQGVQWASLCYAVLNVVCFLFSAVIGKFCNLTSKKFVHSVGLLSMAAAFGYMFFLSTTGPHAATDINMVPWMTLLTQAPAEFFAMPAVQVAVAMGLIGVGWATTLSIPFALLSEHLPAGKEGVMMGVFNIFIAAPGVVSNLLVGYIVGLYGNNVAIAMVVGAASMLVSLLLLQGVKEAEPEPVSPTLSLEDSPAAV